MNEIATRDNLPRPNCDSDGKADNKRQAFINTNTRHFIIQMGDMGPSPGRASIKAMENIPFSCVVIVGVLRTSFLICYLRLPN